jgi:uncharacterized membrane protein YhaH (DUF805 family)
VSTAPGASRQFTAFAAILYSVLAVLNALALTLGLALGHLGPVMVAQMCWLVVFVTLAVVHFRRWRGLRAVRQDEEQ